MKISFEIDASGLDKWMAKLKKDIISSYPVALKVAEETLRSSIEGRLYGSLYGWERSSRSIVNAFVGVANDDGIEIYMDAGLLQTSPGGFIDGRPYFGNYTTLGGADYGEAILNKLDTDGGIGPSKYRKYAIGQTEYFAKFIVEVEPIIIKTIADHLRGLGYSVS